MNSRPGEGYETFVLTLINEKQSFNYNDMSATLVNYEVRRKEKQSSSNSTLAEALVVRSRGSNQKGKGERERFKFRPGFRDLKKNMCAFFKKTGYWKVNYLKNQGYDKGKESKIEANLTQVISTQAGTSQIGGSDSDSSVFSFSVTTPTIGYPSDFE